jgi:hypothetical protein
MYLYFVQCLLSLAQINIYISVYVALSNGNEPDDSADLMTQQTFPTGVMRKREHDCRATVVLSLNNTYPQSLVALHKGAVNRHFGGRCGFGS